VLLKCRNIIWTTITASLVIMTPAYGQTGKSDATQKENPATRVVVNAVRQEPYRQTVPILGRFVTRQAGEIAARINGAIKEFRVDVGDRVKAGDVIAVLVKSRLKWQRDLKRSEVSQFAAQFKTKKQEVILLRQELQRLQSLKKSPAFSQARLDDKIQQIVVAESQALEAQAELNMARANQKLAEIDLQDAEVKAAHAGVISKRHTSLGAYVDVGDPVVTVLDDETMEIEAAVPANHISGAKPHTEVVVVIDKTHRIKAMVRAVIPEENPLSRTRAVRLIPIYPNDSPNIYAANQSVVLHFPAAAAQSVLTVHKDAVISRKGRKIVVLAIDGKAVIRNVKLGPPTGSRFIVEDGLAAGELTIVRGNERLLPGTAVQHKTPEPAKG
jgi:RND family efflux transporter MFP subunit